MVNIPSSLIARLREIADPNLAKQTGSANGRIKTVDESANCDFCGKSIPADHRHFADLKKMKFMCACEMCTILQAEKGEYSQVPQRYLYLKDFDMPEQLWSQLKIPVNMAFIVYHSGREQPIAFYPSPAGATESELSLDTWDDMQQKNPSLKDMAHDLEGFLVNRLDDPAEHYIVPIDCCYKLIGLIRINWEGLHGGEKMRSAVRKFFKDLKQNAV